MRRVLVGITCAVLVAGIGAGTASAGSSKDDSPYAGYTSDTYTDKDVWLCRPDISDDPCDENLDATVIRPDGTTKVEKFKNAKKPKVDCFYVYPTVSSDPTTNSDLVPDPEVEGFTIRNQAARLQSTCRMFAPVYKQVTLTKLLNGLGTGKPPTDDVPAAEAQQIAYESLLDAWKQYIAHDNKGRGVVLVGHSQGSGVLNELIKREIDPNPALRKRLVSALLLGSSVAVPPGEDVGGDFGEVPLCRAEDQVGCVITYESFRPTDPPMAQGGFFGHTELGPAACTNPAALDGGKAGLLPYFLTDRTRNRFLESLGITVPSPPPWIDESIAQVDTPWVQLPDMVDGECVEENGQGFLAITFRNDPADKRVHDTGGDLPNGFGLHLIDANVGMGDLLRIVAAQAEAYTSK